MGRLIEISDPSDDDIARLFGGAKAFVFPSFAEGFGLPPLEAMASGVPVVCSDIPVFREVYGDAVLYVDPNRPESIAAALRALLIRSLPLLRSPCRREANRRRNIGGTSSLRGTTTCWPLHLKD